MTDLMVVIQIIPGYWETYAFLLALVFETDAKLVPLANEDRCEHTKSPIVSVLGQRGIIICF